MNFTDSNVLNPDRRSIAISSKLGARYLLLHSLAHILMKAVGTSVWLLISVAARAYLRGRWRQRHGRYLDIHLHLRLGRHAWVGCNVRVIQLTLEGESNGSHQGETSGALLIPCVSRDLRLRPNRQNLASCHSCLLAPETSCEDFNRYLDRAMLVGTPEDRSIGFYSTVDVD